MRAPLPDSPASTSLHAVGLLDQDAASDPGFVPLLIAPTYVNYYEQPSVLLALGLEPRPPHPLGHTLEPGDLSLLDPVRRRPKLYRDC